MNKLLKVITVSFKIFVDSLKTIDLNKGNEVYCVNIHPTEPTIAVSGGMDDKAHVWNIVTGQTIFECTGLCAFL